MLEVRGLNVGYGPAPVLFDLDLVVEEGSVVALIGPNGAGKTTTLNAIAGLIPRESGTITFDGQPRPTVAEDVVQAGLALIPQGRRIFPRLSVEENLLLGAWCRGAGWRGADERFATVFEYFPVLRERRRQLAGRLSGGEQQQLVIARALLSEPRLVLIDELSLGLAPKMIRTLLAMIGRFNSEQGTAFLLVEQAAAAALEVAGSAYLLQKGRVVESGPAEDLRSDVDALRRAYLGHPAEASGSTNGR